MLESIKLESLSHGTEYTLIHSSDILEFLLPECLVESSKLQGLTGLTEHHEGGIRKQLLASE